MHPPQIPLRVAFRVDHPVLAALSFASDAAFGAEVVFSFFVGFMDTDGRVVFSLRRIAARYLRSWFLVDVFSAIPVEFVTPGDSVFLALLKLARLGRLRKMARGAHEDKSYVAVKMMWLLLARRPAAGCWPPPAGSRRADGGMMRIA